MKKKERSASEKRDRLLGVATAAPAAILLCVFTVYPVIYLIYRSLYSGSLISLEKEFVGLDNYKEILFDETFHKVLVNTIIYTVLCIITCMIVLVTDLRRFRDLVIISFISEFLPSGPNMPVKGAAFVTDFA